MVKFNKKIYVFVFFILVILLSITLNDLEVFAITANEIYFTSGDNTNDAGYVAVGYYASNLPELNISCQGNKDSIIIKYNKYGEVEWYKTFGYNKDDVFSDVLVTDDSIIVVGSTKSDIEDLEGNNHGDGLILKYNLSGKLIAKKRFTGNDKISFDHIAAGSNSDIAVIVGSSYTTDFQGIALQSSGGIIFTIDSDLNITNVNHLVNKKNDWFSGVRKIEDGYITTAVYRTQDDLSLGGIENYESALIKYDNDLNVVWHTELEGNGADYFNSVMEASDGFYVAAHSYSTDIPGFNNHGFADALLLKYDKDGNLKWIKSEGETAYDAFYTIVIDGDDIYAFGEFSDGKYYKYDKNGNLLSTEHPIMSNCITKVLNVNGNYVLIGSTKNVTNMNELFYSITNYYSVQLNYDNNMGVVNINKDFYEPNEDVEISYTAKNNYYFKSIEIKDANNNNISMSNNKFTMPESNVIIRVIFDEKVNYRFISGENQTFEKKSGKNLMFKIDGPFQEFKEIYINDTKLDNSYYKAESGSVIVTLYNEYLENLAVGKYNITFEFEDSNMKTKFTVKKANQNDNKKESTKTKDLNEKNPDTIDNIHVYFHLLFLSIVVTIFLMAVKKYDSKHR